MVHRAGRVLAHLRMGLVDLTPHIRCQDVLIFQLARVVRCAGSILFSRDVRRNMNLVDDKRGSLLTYECVLVKAGMSVSCRSAACASLSRSVVTVSTFEPLLTGPVEDGLAVGSVLERGKETMVTGAVDDLATESVLERGKEVMLKLEEKRLLRKYRRGSGGRAAKCKKQSNKEYQFRGEVTTTKV